jgi:hypothetical protein
MADILETGCELWIREGWQPITLEEALGLNPRRMMRCPVCHGRVRAVGADNGILAHFEHFECHSGCYREATFDGNPSPHPKSLRK